MKILIIGLLVFFGWGALSTHLYVCKIRGLCNEPGTLQNEMVINNDIIDDDTLSEPLTTALTAIPGALSVYFEFDKYEFNSDALTDKYFNEANAFLTQNSLARLNITGHTDEIGTDEYNQALGYRRAQSMLHYFERKGIQANKIIIESRGEKDPADNNNTETGRANNRRTITTIK